MNLNNRSPNYFAGSKSDILPLCEMHDPKSLKHHTYQPIFLALRIIRYFPCIIGAWCTVLSSRDSLFFVAQTACIHILTNNMERLYLPLILPYNTLFEFASHSSPNGLNPQEKRKLPTGCHLDHWPRIYPEEHSSMPHTSLTEGEFQKLSDQ